MIVDLNKDHISILNDRILFPDGDSVVSMQFLYDRILNDEPLDDVYLSKKDYNSFEVQEYNGNFENKLMYKSECRELDLSWDLPSEYKEIDLKVYSADKLQKEFKKCTFTDEEKSKRIFRLKMELRIITERNLEDMMKCLIYIIDTFKSNSIIWGTGRGSSCACYMLYLFGVHQVDSVYYNLDVSEFFR